jgi:hypothetical protein
MSGAAPHAHASEPSDGGHSYAPPGGVVADSATAVAIAEAVLVPVYGRARIDAQKPLIAELRGETWVVTGQLPPSTAGGVALVEIDKRAGCILRMSHGR